MPSGLAQRAQPQRNDRSNACFAVHPDISAVDSDPFMDPFKSQSGAGLMVEAAFTHILGINRSASESFNTRYYFTICMVRVMTFPSAMSR